MKNTERAVEIEMVQPAPEANDSSLEVVNPSPKRPRTNVEILCMLRNMRCISMMH
jgi:hypothetical protein